jgi:DNA-directed RNA polymerase specialized sigma24 family protein
MNLDDLLPAIAAGDADAFAQWMGAAEAPLRRGLSRFAALVDTEAVLQETLLRVWQVAPRVQVDARGNSLLRLAHTIARNAALDEARRMGNRAQVPVEEAHAFEEPVPPDPMLRAAIVDCHDKLPPTPRRALTQRMEAAGGTEDRDLARAAKQTLNTFLQNVTRAKKLLRSCLETKGIALELP